VTIFFGNRVLLTPGVICVCDVSCLMTSGGGRRLFGGSEL